MKSTLNGKLSPKKNLNSTEIYKTKFKFLYPMYIYAISVFKAVFNEKQSLYRCG